MNDQDQDLVRVFTALRQPVDRVACYKRLRELFLGALSSQTRRSCCDDDLIWRLFQLRKNRKLPTLHRETN